MPKTVPAALATHSALTTTTFATCWKLTRQDGEVFAFTGHDRDLTVGGINYLASSAFTRTTIDKKNDLSPANMDVEGIMSPAPFLLDNDRILDSDIRAGLFDHSLVEVFLVNWKSLSDGQIDFLKGNMGQISLSDNTFTTEIRGLSQRLDTRVLEMYTQDCRADLGDLRCTREVASLTETSVVDVLVNNREFDLPDDKTLQETVTDFGQIDQGVVWANSQVSLRQLSGTDATEVGTVRNPIIISSVAELEGIAASAETLQRHYALDSDIDFTAAGTKTAVLIAGDFKGTLDGRGHKIHNVNAVTASSVRLGLFESMGSLAVVRRLRIEDSTFDSGIGAGADVGPFCAHNMHGLIMDCLSINNTLEGDRCGGVAGEIDSTGVILRCFASNIYTDISGQTIGGIVAEENGDGSLDRLIDCYFDYEFSKNNGGEASLDVPVGTGSQALALTTVQAQTRSSYATYAGTTQASIEYLITQPGATGFTWGTPWYIDDGVTYPKMIAVDS